MFNRFPALNDAPLFQVPSHLGLVPLTDSVARKHLKNISILYHLINLLRFMILEGLGPSGHSNMVFLYRTSKHKARGLHSVCGDMYTFLFQGVPGLLSPFVPISPLSPTSLLGVWVLL